MKKMILLMLMSLPLVLSAQNTKEQEYQKTKTVLESKQYTFDARSINPSWGGSRDLTTNPGYITIQKDSVDIQLPYFGVRRGGATLGEPGGLHYKGPMEAYSVDYKDGKRRAMVNFRAGSGGDRMDVQLQVGGSGWTQVIIRATYLDAVGYYGRIEPSEADSL